MNVKVLHEKSQVIRMGTYRSSIPIDKAPPKVASQPKASSPKGASQYKAASPPKVAQTKCSPSPQKPQQQQQKPQHKPPFNSNVCFLCGKEGHYGSQTSCHAANKVRKAHFN
jgi:hypothetical protein